MSIKKNENEMISCSKEFHLATEEQESCTRCKISRSHTKGLQDVTYMCNLVQHLVKIFTINEKSYSTVAIKLKLEQHEQCCSSVKLPAGKVPREEFA